MYNLDIIKRKDGESLDSYKVRLFTNKNKYGLTWNDIADILNSMTGNNFTEDKYRKEYIKNINLVNTENDDTYSKILAIKKLKVQLTDERTQANNYYRRLSREDSIIEIAKDYADKMNSKKMLDYNNIVEISEANNEAILVISDWHYGIEVDNYFNKYNQDIAKKRISYLRDKTIENCVFNHVKKLHVVNLSDLISGRIHSQIRIENRIDVITQVMDVSEILAELLNDLSKYFCIEYYDCLDNHSRIEPNKKESLDLESLTRIIPWFLKDRLRANERIHINSNDYGQDIITFDIGKYRIAGVHGDRDSISSVSKNLSAFTNEHFDLILTGHFHHFSGSEENMTVILGNGSLMGVDDFAFKKRLTSHPSQNLVIVSDNNITEAIYRITLDV